MQQLRGIADKPRGFASLAIFRTLFSFACTTYSLPILTIE